MSIRLAEEIEPHDKTVGLIAKRRFSFPNDEHPNWRTYTNHPEQTKGIRKDSDAVYADIVVVDTNQNVAVMIGEVETSSTITDDEAKSEWKDYSSVCRTFFLYVPNDLVDKTKELLDKHKIHISGLRGYYYNEEGKLVIINY